MDTPAPKPNVALVVLGAVALVAALAAGVMLAINLSQYLTIEDDWSRETALSPEARRFGTSLIKRAAFQRVLLFGPLTIGLGVLGMFLTKTGRKKT